MTSGDRRRFGASRFPIGGLGELERAVLEELWSRGPADVKAVHRAVGVARGIAPNTVQSTLERLHRKGLTTRSKRGRAYEYAASLSRREWLGRAIEDLVRGVPGTGADSVAAAFVDVAQRTGAEHLDELERRLRERRQRESES